MTSKKVTKRGQVFLVSLLASGVVLLLSLTLFHGLDSLLPGLTHESGIFTLRGVILMALLMFFIAVGGALVNDRYTDRRTRA